MSADYLRGAFSTDKNQVTKAYWLVDEIQRVLPQFFDRDEGAWPYLVSEEEGERPNPQYSFSTNAMILFSLAISAGLLGDSALFPTQVPRRSIDSSRRPDDPEYIEVLQTGLLRLIAESDNLNEDNAVVYSQTFGPDDPFTLTWVAAVCRATHGSLSAEIEDFENRLRKKTEDRLRGLKDQISQKGSERDRAVLEVPVILEKSRDSTNDAVPHVFPLLRMVHLALESEQLKRVLSGTSTLGNADLNASYNLMRANADLARPLRQIFRDRVHLQLSYHRIPDSDFDIGELVFALEGLLLTEEGVESNLITTVFKAIEEKQAHNPYWRPLRPFMAKPQGWALLPLSVEVANSLLRSCLILEQRRDQDTSYFSQYVDLFRRYEQWLRSRMVRGRASGEKNFVGWHSEHVLPPDTIHLWDTSQVLLFLVLYAELMQRHLALRSLDAADLRALDQGPNSVQKAQLAKMNDTRAQQRNGEASLNNDRDRTAHSTQSPSLYDIKARMEMDFVDQWSNWDGRDRRNCSMLFYGPPGTGKTTLAETLDGVANELARRGVPSPTGKPIWNKPALRWLLRSPVYEAQEYEEVVNHVSLEALSRLEPGRRYGLWPYGTRTVKVSREWDPERGDYRNRYAYSRRPEEQLAYVPVPDCGIPRETVLRAREELGKRRSRGRRDPERIWELRGMLRCPDCGSVLRPYTNARRNKNGSERRYYYYSCRSRFDTAKAECSFRKNLPADATEEAVWGLLSGVLSKPEIVAERFERFLGDERRGLHGTPERDAAAWEQRLKELEEERRGYLRLAAQGRVVDHELDTLLSEVEEQRERAQEELRRALGRKEHLRTLAHRRELVLKLWKRLGGDRAENVSSGERMQWYERLRVTATPTEDGDLCLRGLFDDADVCRTESKRSRASRPASRPSGEPRS